MAVIETKFMWLGSDGQIHYVSKEKFDSILAGAEKVVNGSIKVAVFSGITGLTGGNVFAATSISQGLQPIVDLVADLAQPICYTYFLKGFLRIGQGRDEEGKKILKDAGMGFLGCRFVPDIMRFLNEVDLFV